MNFFSKNSLICFLAITMGLVIITDTCQAGSFGLGNLTGKKNRSSSSSDGISIEKLKEYYETIKGFKDAIDLAKNKLPEGQNLTPNQYMSALDSFGFSSSGDGGQVKAGLLAVAAYTGDVNSVDEYLSQGSDINFKSKIGASPLMIAMLSQSANKSEIIKKILSHHADANTTFTGEKLTPLMVAAMGYGDKNIVNDLLSSNADINAKSAHGMTPIIIGAAIGSNPEVISAMLNSGADPEAIAEAGLTASAIGVLNGNGDVRSLFLNTKNVAKKTGTKILKKKFGF